MTALPDSGYIIAVPFTMGMVTPALCTLPLTSVRTLGGSPLLKFLGTTMPVGVVVVLVAYAVFGRPGLSGEGGNPGAAQTVPVALAITTGLHWWWRDTVISIFVSTTLYIALMNLIA